MRVFMNFSESRGLSGGAHSFLRALRRELKKKGIVFTNRVDGDFDVALLNALTNRLDIGMVKRIHEKGRPIIHRKVGYSVSGSEAMRQVVSGVVEGDRRQIEFSSYITHTVFQSEYSRDVFFSEGFRGPYTLIANGADKDTFNRMVRPKIFGWSRQRRGYRQGSSGFRFAIVTWSKDMNKGFDDYKLFDQALDEMPDVEIWFIGRKPSNIKFKNIRVFRPRRHTSLAKKLKQCDGFIQMARNETCSNALLEGICCGLPVIFKDSGSTSQFASRYGVEYKGDPQGSMRELMYGHELLVRDIDDFPYSIQESANKYFELLNEVLGG